MGREDGAFRVAAQATGELRGVALPAVEQTSTEAGAAMGRAKSRSVADDGVI
jgi:hypothetical protein